MERQRPFHVAFVVDNLSAARQFYGAVLGCPEGRASETWIDFDLFGHQIVAHLRPVQNNTKLIHNHVDGDEVPVPHFGVVLNMEQWRAFSVRLESKGVKFLIHPHIRFKGQAGEQATMFFMDPAGNALEFKAFADDRQLFAR